MKLQDFSGNVTKYGEQAALELGMFGDGSDGALVFDGSASTVDGALASPRNLNIARTGSSPNYVYTLTRSVFCSALTVGANITLKTAGYKIFCSGLLQVASTGKISYVGNDGGVGSAGDGLAAGEVGGSAAGGAGGAGDPTDPGAGQVGADIQNSMGGAGGAGGGGGSAGERGGTGSATGGAGGADGGGVT